MAEKAGSLRAGWLGFGLLLVLLLLLVFVLDGVSSTNTSRRRRPNALHELPLKEWGCGAYNPERFDGPPFSGPG
jgi:hypothetical protein